MSAKKSASKSPAKRVAALTAEADAPVGATPAPVTLIAFKGFNPDFVCSPNGKAFQYAIGQTYEHQGDVVRCAEGGFHSCEFPLDVFRYYAPTNDAGRLNRFAEVVAGGTIDRDNDDSKIASATITIKAEIGLGDLTRRAIAWITARIDRSVEGVHCTGDYSAASNTGTRSAASNTGDYSAASVSGSHSVAMASGIEGMAKASAGSAIVLCNRDDYGALRHIRAAIAGANGVKADAWYSLDAQGEFVEVAA